MSSRLMPPKPGAIALTMRDDLVGVLGRQRQRPGVDAGELLEQHRLALHHGHRRLGADVAQAEHGRAVGDNRDGVLLDRQRTRLLVVLGDGQADAGHARACRPSRGRRASSSAPCCGPRSCRPGASGRCGRTTLTMVTPSTPRTVSTICWPWSESVAETVMSRIVCSRGHAHQVDRADLAVGVGDRRRHRGERAGAGGKLDAHRQAVGGRWSGRHETAKGIRQDPRCGGAKQRSGSRLGRMVTAKQTKPSELDLSDEPAHSCDVFLVDGNGLAYRGFYALPEELQTVDGQPTNALLGMANMLMRLLVDYRPKTVLVAWDERPTRRLELDPSYKAGRKPTPELLKAQQPYFAPLVEAFGYRNLRVEGNEADDVIGTLVDHRRGAGPLGVRGLHRPRRLPARLRQGLHHDDTAWRLGRGRLHAREDPPALRHRAGADPRLHRPQGRHVRQHPRACPASETRLPPSC